MKISSPLSILFLFASFIASHGQRISFGTCPTSLASATGVTFNSLAQTYREYGRTRSLYSHTWRCTTYSIAQLISNAKYRITINARDKISGQAVTASGTIDVAGQATAATSLAGAYLTVTISYGGFTKTLNYFILAGSAAATYVVLYNCQNLIFTKVESVIVLAATSISIADLDTALASLTAIGFPLTALQYGYDTNCAVS